jgi:hypothetical protein
MLISSFGRATTSCRPNARNDGDGVLAKDRICRGKHAARSEALALAARCCLSGTTYETNRTSGNVLPLVQRTAKAL